MSLNIGDALSTGWAKLTTTAGIQLAIAYIVLQLMTVVGMFSAVSAVTDSQMMGSEVETLALPIGVAAGVALLLIGMVANLGLTVVLLRTVSHDAAVLDSFPAGVTDGLPITMVFLAIAGIIQAVAVFIGSLLLIIPGIFLMVCLVFTQVFVAVEGEGPLEALSSSWALSKGKRLPLFGLGVVVAVLSALVTLPTNLVSMASQPAGTLFTYVITGLVNVFTNAALVAAYQQLSDENPALSTTDSDEFEYAA